MSAASSLRYAVVVPTVGRPSLVRLLESLAAQTGPLPEQVVVVDDRPPAGAAQPVRVPPEVSPRLVVRVVRSLGRGPAAARNAGWRLCPAPWVAFLDDDVVLPPGWADRLAADIEACGPLIGGSQGRIVVPLPRDRRPTDWERGTAGLATARWATADMCYRRSALDAVHGFDERFPRAYREDADLALRVRRAGWALVVGSRTVVHPVRPAGPRASFTAQRGNADDALMRRLHGRQWRRDAQTGRGRLPWHVATTAAGALAVLAGWSAGCSGRVTTAFSPAASTRIARRTAFAGGLTWAALTADFARRRILPGPRDPREVTTMLWTSVAIPPAALAQRVRGWWRHRRAQAWPPRPAAVLFDRDGTLIDDIPYNGDPRLVTPVAGARDAVARVRSRGLRVGVVSNQSGVARGLLTTEQVASVNAAVDAQLGPFDTWQVCPHGPDDGCPCRKPSPGLVLAAARDLGVRPEQCVLIGDIGADVTAALSAGARPVLVPTPVTRPEEVAAAPVVVADLPSAVDLALTWSPRRPLDGVAVERA